MSEPMSIRVTVNGTGYERAVEPRLLLSDFLRHDLRLTGTHVGCDTSQCGACTVHMNGAAVKACSILAGQADGASVTTIEGINNGKVILKNAFKLFAPSMEAAS